MLLAAIPLVGVPLGIGAAWFEASADGATAADVPTWQAVAGLALAAVGLVVLFRGTIAQIRANRRTSAWRSPLHVLTTAQRKELLGCIRGRDQCAGDQLALARHLATSLLDQRPVLSIVAGQAALWAGLLVAFPSWWRVAVAVPILVAAGVSGPLLLRQERQARRFLAEHPGS